MTPKIVLLNRILIALCAITIATLSLLPAEDAIAVEIWDKAQHFVAYATFTVLAFPLCKTHTARLLNAVGIFGFSIVIEYVQQFSPGRDTSLADVAANSLGVVSGYLIAWLCYRVYLNLRSRTAT